MTTRDLKSGRISAAEKAELERLALEGLTPTQIAARMRRNAKSLYYHLHGMGLIDTRGRALRCSYTPEEDALIVGLRVEGLKISDIARLASEKFGRRVPQNSVAYRLIVLASRDEAGESLGDAAAVPTRLSPPEDRVFALTAAGLSIKQIARRMGVGVGSVTVFLHRLKKKLRADSAIQIALLWHGCDTQEALAFGDSLAASFATEKTHSEEHSHV